MITDAKTLREQTIQYQIEKVEQLIIDASNNGYFKVRIRLPLDDEVRNYFKALNYMINFEGYDEADYFISWN